MRIENNTTTYLVILSLILTCGFFVSNLAFQKNYSQKYDETQRSIQLLNETSQNFQENILAVILRVDSLESRLSGISSELVSYEYSIMELENEIETLNDRVDYIEEQYEIEVRANEDKLEQINNLEDHISNLYSELGVTEGNKLYLDHNIKFEYPEQMNITEQGLRMRDATSLNGIVNGFILDGNNTEIMVTYWDYDYFGFYSESLSDQLNDEIDELNKQEGYHIETGMEKSMTHLGHNLIYIDISGYLYNQTLTGRIGGWVCTNEKRVHILLIYTVGEADPETLFDKYLETFSCHR